MATGGLECFDFYEADVIARMKAEVMVGDTVVKTLASDLRAT
jgi:hypothetical protein